MRTFLALASGSLLCTTALCAWMTVRPFAGGGPALTALLGSLLLLSAALGTALAAVLQHSRPPTIWAGVAWCVSGVVLLAAAWGQSRLLASLEPQGLLVAVAIDFVVFFLPPLLLSTAMLFTTPGRDGHLRSTSTAWLSLSGVAAAVTFGASIQWGLATFGVSRLLTWSAAGALACAALLFAQGILGRRRRTAGVMAIVLLLALGGFAPHPGPHPHGLRALRHTGTTELRVLDHEGYRHLLVDGVPLIAVDPATGDAVAPDASTLELALQFFWPPGRVLLLGVPDPQFVRALSQRGWRIDVSASRSTLELARRHLGLEASLFTWRAPSVVLGGLLDPAHAALPEAYEIVVVQLRGAAQGLQAFATRSGVQALQRLLTEDGILLLRLEAPGWGDPWPRAVGAGLLERFREVWCLPVTGGPRNAGSLVFVASEQVLEIRQHHLPTPQDHPNHPEAQLQSGRARNAWRYRFVPDVEDATVLELSHDPAAHWMDTFHRAERRRLHRRLGGRGFTW